MDLKKEINYWLASAAHDLEAAEALFEKEKYDWCLFLANLVMEKTLKAFYVRDIGELPPKTHNLESLVKKTTLKLTREENDFLRKINTFNMEGRYPDKQFDFYKKCDYTFARENFEKIKEFRKCLLQKIQS